MIIALDVDGVTADLDTELIRRYNHDYDDDLTREKIRSFDLHLYVKPECGYKIYDYFKAPDLYECITPVLGAREGVQALRADGHTVLHVSTCTFGMTDQKAQWLMRHGFSSGDPQGTFLPDDFIVTRDKQHVDAHMLIDDGAHNIRSWVENKRRKAILVNFPHNRLLVEEVPSTFWSWCTRVDTWPEIVKYIQRLGEQTV